MSSIDYLPGDPALRVVGKPEEQKARRHRPQDPKPTKTARVISADIEHRIQIIEPLIAEYEVLKQVHAALNPAAAPKPKRKYNKRTNKPRKPAKKVS